MLGALRVIFAVLLSLAATLTAVAAQGTATGKLTIVRGGAGVVKGDGTPISPAYTGLEIGQGDRIGTFSRSDVVIDLPGGARLDLGSESTVALHQVTKAGGRAGLTIEPLAGTVRYQFKPADVSLTLWIHGQEWKVGSSRTASAGRRAEPTPPDQVSAASLSLRAEQPVRQVPIPVSLELEEMVTVTFEDGTTVTMITKGQISTTDGEVIAGPGVGLVHQKDGTTVPFEFDPNTGLVGLTSQAIAKVRELQGESGAGNKVASVERTNIRDFERKEDKPKDNGDQVGQNGSAGNNTGGGNLARLNLSTSQRSFFEPGVGVNVQEFILFVTNTTGQPITVDFQFVNGTAQLGTDFQVLGGPPAGTLTFPPGTTVKTLTFGVNGDGTAEGPETFSVEFTNVNGAQFGTGFDSGNRINATINDNI